MCLVLLARDAHPDYPLIIAANRDERHGRAAQPLHWWPDRPQVAGGRDAEAHGTWMAVHADGRFAALLNDARASTPAAAPSRGELVPWFLGAGDPAHAIDDIHAHADRYAGFHFVAGGVGRVWYCSRPLARPRTLARGVHAIDNDGLDSGGARLERARAAFMTALEREPSPEALLGLLADEGTPAPGSGDTRPVFVRGETFGTRCSTVLRVDAGGRADMVERSFDASAARRHERRLDWAFALAAG